MKILLLMPLNETSHYLAMQLMVEAEHAGFDALSVPNFADYLVTTKLAQNVPSSIIMALIAAQLHAEQHENCLIIGNCSTDIKFDLILNVNPHHEEGQAAEDVELLQLQKTFGDDEKLGPIVTNVYHSTDGEYATGATAEQIIELVQNLCQAISN